jgi:hypothetical protein
MAAELRAITPAKAAEMAAILMFFIADLALAGGKHSSQG